MVEDFIKPACWPFLLFLFFLCGIFSKKIFLLLIALLLLFFNSYLLFYVTVLHNAWCVESHGQPVVAHVIALWICSLYWSSCNNQFWTTPATFSGAPDWICCWYVFFMFVSMIIHDHVINLLEMEKEFFPVGAYSLLCSISILCNFSHWFWKCNHF